MELSTSQFWWHRQTDRLEPFFRRLKEVFAPKSYIVFVPSNSNQCFVLAIVVSVGVFKL